MNKVVPINSGRFVGSYYAQNSGERIPEKGFLLAGVILSVFLQIINCAYGGLVPTIMFAGSVLVGSILGLAIYYKLPYQVISIRSVIMPQAPPSVDAMLKKVA